MYLNVKGSRIKNAKKNSLVVVSSDVVPDALNLVMKLKEKDNAESL